MTFPPSVDYGSLKNAGQAVSLIATPEARSIMQVVAPANLPEGYVLEVESSGQQFAVVVVSMSTIAALYR
jgi:hypothetical protein